MKLALRHREQLMSLSVPLTEELDSISATLSATWDRQHDTDGSHGDVTVESLGRNTSTSDPVHAIPLAAGLRALVGPWVFDQIGNDKHVAGLRPSTIRANTHDYAPAGINTAIVIEVDTDADRELTGISIGDVRQKRLLLFGNRGSFNITMKHNDSASKLVNRFGFPTSTFVLGPGEYVWLYYDTGSEVWRGVVV